LDSLNLNLNLNKQVRAVVALQFVSNTNVPHFYLRQRCCAHCNLTAPTLKTVRCISHACTFLSGISLMHCWRQN